jgi:3',5'-cyclic AMP phosphodiesterase CpdA
MFGILHLSDFHYGDSEFKENCMENVIQYANARKNNIDLIIITGDITNRGRYNEYEGIKKYIDRLEGETLIVVGNHDSKYNGILNFEKFFGPRISKKVFEQQNVLALGLRSAKDDLKLAELGDLQLKFIIEQFQQHLTKKKILALHHHLIAVPYAGRTWNTLIDAGEVLEIIRMYNVDLVLMGHRHVPHVWNLNETTFLYCGTSTSGKLRANEPPSFNHIQFNNSLLHVDIVNSLTLKREPLFKKNHKDIGFVKFRKTRLEHLLEAEMLG